MTPRIACMGKITSRGILWYINPAQLAQNRRWYSEYLYMLRCGGTFEAAYDYANGVTSQPINDGPFSGDFTDVVPAQDREGWVGS